MELNFYLTLLLGFVSFITFSLFFLFYRHRSQFTGNNLPPGQVGYPVIGESYEFLSSGWKGHPEKFIFDRMTKFSSEVFKTSIFGEKACIFAGAACNKFLFSNENKLVTAWWPSSVDKVFPSSMETSAKEEAKKMRKLLPNFMNPQALQRYIGIMDTIAQRHFALGWENKKQVEVFPLAKNYTFWLAARLFVSLEDPRTEELYKIIKQRKIDLAEGKASPTQDILSHMLLTCDEEGTYMKEMDIADKILGLLIGGHDTASATCTFIVKYLGELPHIYDAVYKEQMEIANSKAPGELLNWDDLQKMKYSWNVAQEVLRVAPPLQGAFREALQDFVFNGFTIPKGWKLYWSANSTHKSAAYFPEPQKFDPTRFEGNGPAPYTFVPFGGGPRMCPGKEYARLEILVFMHNLVKRFKWEAVIPDEKIVVDPLPMPAKGLPIRLFPHKKA
ncbi:hypothetical protein M0R45_018110 [Rubus argutus]|uniref:Cytochrome P450 n=1 Tax=Rubus argutus TaxID=59490 RepID=A0AAW1X2X3_RUBAR